MATLRVQPRQTPAERDDHPLEVQVDEDLSVLVATIEEWVEPRPNWDVVLGEGHAFDRPNNVEVRLAFVEGTQTSSLSFRLEQLERADDIDGELVLIFEEQDGIAKIARATQTGLAVELHHILTFT